MPRSDIRTVMMIYSGYGQAADRHRRKGARGGEGRARHEDVEGYGQRGAAPRGAGAGPPGRQSARHACEGAVAGPSRRVALTHLVDTSVLTRLGHTAVRM